MNFPGPNLSIDVSFITDRKSVQLSYNGNPDVLKAVKEKITDLGYQVVV